MIKNNNVLIITFDRQFAIFYRNIMVSVFNGMINGINPGKKSPDRQRKRHYNFQQCRKRIKLIKIHIIVKMPLILSTLMDISIMNASERNFNKPLSNNNYTIYTNF